MAKLKSAERVAEVADTLDNLVGALQLPLPATMHVDQMKNHLPELRDKLRAVYIDLTGYDPWRVTTYSP